MTRTTIRLLSPPVAEVRFYSQLPADRRIGMDVEPRCEGTIKTSYLTYTPEDRAKKYVVVGNPPFGKQGKLAKLFIEYSYRFADIVAFILPPMFKQGVKGISYNLHYSEELGNKGFEFPDGSPTSVNAVFNIYSKLDADVESADNRTCDEYVELYNIPTYDKDSREYRRLKDCDLVVPYSSYKHFDVTMADGFSTLKDWIYLGIKVKKEREQLIEFIKGMDFRGMSHTQTTGARNIRSADVRRAIIEAGFVDSAQQLAMDAPRTCDDYVELYCIRNMDNSPQGLNKLDRCDILVQSTDYPPLEVVEDMEALEKKAYIGIRIKRDKPALQGLLSGLDYTRLGNKTTTRVVNLTMQAIRDAIINAGYVDSVVQGGMF